VAVGQDQRRAAPFGFAPGVQQQRATARAAPGLDVVERVTDHPGRCQVDSVGTRRADQHARGRCAAQASGLAFGRRCVRAHHEVGQRDACSLAQVKLQHGLQPRELPAGEAPERQAALVGHHDQGQSGRRQRGQ
jgi:hypothetical protein